MCMQCAMSAMTAGVAATGAKAWIEARLPAFATGPAAHRALKISIAAAWVLAAGIFGAGSS